MIFISWLALYGRFKTKHAAAPVSTKEITNFTLSLLEGNVCYFSLNRYSFKTKETRKIIELQATRQNRKQCLFCFWRDFEERSLICFLENKILQSFTNFSYIDWTMYIWLHRNWMIGFTKLADRRKHNELIGIFRSISCWGCVAVFMINTPRIWFYFIIALPITLPYITLYCIAWHCHCIILYFIPCLEKYSQSEARITVA